MAVVVDRRTKLTYEDSLLFPEDGRRHEIIAYRDRGLKLDLYQKAGVSEDWIVDPERKVVQQYVLTDGVFRSAVACTGTPHGAPIEVDLSEVWRWL